MSQKIDININSVVELKLSVDCMGDKILKQTKKMDDSNKASTEGLQLIKTSMSQSLKSSNSTNPFSYSSKLQNGGRMAGNETPRTPKSDQVGKAAAPLKLPSFAGTSVVQIGKPLSPNPSRPLPNNVNRVKFEKAIWIKRFHRDTTDEEISSHIKLILGVADSEKFRVRKLIKKDRLNSLVP